MNRLRNFLYSRGQERGRLLWLVKYIETLWTELTVEFGVGYLEFSCECWKSLTSHAPGWVLPLLASLRQKTHHLFIIHLLDLLKVNRMPASC